MKKYLWLGILAVFMQVEASENPFDLKKNFGELEKEQDSLIFELKKGSETQEVEKLSTPKKKKTALNPPPVLDIENLESIVSDKAHINHPPQEKTKNHSQKKKEQEKRIQSQRERIAKIEALRIAERKRQVIEKIKAKEKANAKAKKEADRKQKDEQKAEAKAKKEADRKQKAKEKKEAQKQKVALYEKQRAEKKLQTKERKKRQKDKQDRIKEIQAKLKEINKKQTIDKEKKNPKVTSPKATKLKPIIPKPIIPKTIEKKPMSKAEKQTPQKNITSFDDINLTKEKLDATLKADNELAAAIIEMDQED